MTSKSDEKIIRPRSRRYCYNITMNQQEQTLVLIKPDAIEKRICGLIIDRLERLGLVIAGAKVVALTEELARAHYSNLAGQPFLPNVVKFMMGDFNHISNHKIYAFVLQGEDAIAKVRACIGATNPEQAEPWTIRGNFGRIADGVMQNCVHASGSPEDAAREIALWFKPEEVIK